MHANAPNPRQKGWHRKLLPSGYFLSALLFHLIVFLLVATLVIWKTPPDPPTSVFQGVSIALAPPPVLPPSSGAAANNPQFEPQPVVVPVVTPPSAITSLNSSAFKVDVSAVTEQALSHLSNEMAQGTGLSSGGGDATGTGSAFGSSVGTSNHLTGYFYDLKQTSDKQPTGMTQDRYYDILANYVRQGWDDSLLAPYYKSKSPLYTDNFAISTRPSEEAPKAFGLEKEVQPGLWVVHYHAKVTAPQPGEYRLAGFGDNVLVVKINGETVLDAGWNFLSKKEDLHRPLPYAMPSYVAALSFNPGCIANLRIGPTFRIDVAETVDMDVLIGDDGGVCSFFLLIQNMSNTYEALADGTPKLPFFQLNTQPAPTFSDSEEHPPYSTKPEPWQSPAVDR